MIYHLDYETYSEADLKNWGAYRYACDLTSEILIFAIAENDSIPLVWDVLDSFGENEKALVSLAKSIEGGSLIYAHNAQFEIAITKYLFEKTFNLAPPTLEQWRCTAAMCRRAAIPSSLEAAAEFLELETQKDKAGKKLIQRFSKPRRPTKKDPRTRIRPEDDPAAFAEFGEYCRTDVETEQALHAKLAAFELKGLPLRSFQFDARMNDHGIPVDVDTLELVREEVDHYTEAMVGKYQSLTGLNPTQRDKSLRWFRERGYPFQDLQAESVKTVLNSGPCGWSVRHVTHKRECETARWQEMNPDTDPPGHMTADEFAPVNMSHAAFEALTIRAQVSFAAVKKVVSMLDAACPDGRVRGALLWSGAIRTHRWAGRIIQPQNFKRPTIKDTRGAFDLIKGGDTADTIELLYAPYFETVASCIRHFIAPKTGELLQADFSSVEARAAAWLCDEKNKLRMFEQNAPVYETMAAKIFGVTVSQVIAEHYAGDSEKRFVGKQAELGSTYQMGHRKFRMTCEKYNYKPSARMVEEFKPRFAKQLAHVREDCKTDAPFDRFEIDFPKPKWAKLRNEAKDGQFVRRAFEVYAYRPDGTRRKIKDLQYITDEEWADLAYDDLADRAISAWRKDNKHIVAAWKSLDIAAKKAIQNPGRVFNGTDKISFGVTDKPGFRALLMNLPGGHNLVYPKPRLCWKGDGNTPRRDDDYFNMGIAFWGKLPSSSQWGWCDTYGGKLLENATQATCGDLMAHGACVAEQHGYDIFMLVHDEAISLKKQGQTHEELCKHLCTLPDWAGGMPLAAEGNTIPFYMKT